MTDSSVRWRLANAISTKEPFVEVAAVVHLGQAVTDALLLQTFRQPAQPALHRCALALVQVGGQDSEGEARGEDCKADHELRMQLGCRGQWRSAQHAHDDQPGR